MLLLVLAIVTGFSRVYVGFHYPGDIAGAAALSFVAAIAIHLLRDRLDAIPERLIKVYGRLLRVAPRR
ncbi:phosphatase PAP2 family protein [Cohnella sp. GCM10012308]|uniref:phosphatase PAP2 family protein n=1 Tax=Cohnella sp. GCM10012308 TaxID=3317329 RepID=UPI00360B6B9B